MALTKSTVKRAAVAAGNDFLVLEDTSNRRAQAVGEVDDLGNHIVFGSNYATAGIAETLAAINLAMAGSLGEIYGYSDPGGPAAAVCLMVFDQLAVPTNGTIPKWRIPLLSGKGGYSFPKGLSYSTGLYAAFSSTDASLTLAGTVEGFIQARYN